MFTEPDGEGVERLLLSPSRLVESVGGYRTRIR